MQDDDPFSEPEDPDRTIIKPAPGGRRRAVPLSEPRPAAPSPRVDFSALAEGGTGRNPLTDAAATLFALVKRLRDTPHYGDVPQLHANVLGAVRAFEAKARERSASPETVGAAGYALCALIDETVMSTPWGADSLWSQQSLLSSIHDDRSGGERFFQILESSSQDPAGNIDLLELLYICLSLGFQGKFRVIEGGILKLAEIQQGLYRRISNHRGDYERELSPRWRGLQDRRPAVSRFVPIWVVPIVTCALAVAIYMGFSHFLNRSSDAVYATLSELGREISLIPTPAVAVVPSVAPAVPSMAPADDSTRRISGFLAEEIRLGLVDVFDLGTSTRVVVHNKGLFASGRATVTREYVALVNKIALAIKPEAGPFLITGHTDSQPIRTLRFPSNWHLSQARADAVVAILAQTIGEPNALVSEGRADTEGLASNETAEGRQANRRIEINVPKR
jgi:type VI secretion system protein ImpK